MSLQTFSNIVSERITKYTIFLSLIIGITIGIRFYYFPSDVPLNADALYYFWYSSDIYHIGKLPDDWSPYNNGWPIFVSIFFTIIDSKDIFALMQIQRLISVIISILIIIPVYFLCKKFVAKKFALIGASFIAFDPRLMVNSFLGVTDPLYLLLITTSLALFLFSNKKTIYFSFMLISFATIVRVEGFLFFLVLSLIFLIRYRKENYKIFFKYLIIFGIFMLIVFPINIYLTEQENNKGIFARSFDSGGNIISSLTNENPDYPSEIIFDGSKIFIQYLIWVLIPNFIIFMPLGLFLIFRNRNFEKNTIILLLFVTAIPAFYSYMNNILDTRYLYVLFPMFSVLAVLSIQKIVGKQKNSNIITVIIISAIIISSLVFYNYLKIDYDHEKESFEIMSNISSMINGTNFVYQESSYLKTSQTIEQWPGKFTEMGLGKYKITTISTNNFNSLEDYIVESKDDGLTHIIVDEKKDRQDFLVDVFENEGSYTYLEKIYDSKMDGFVYHMKVFKIDYELFNSLKNNNLKIN